MRELDDKEILIVSGGGIFADVAEWVYCNIWMTRSGERHFGGAL